MSISIRSFRELRSARSWLALIDVELPSRVVEVAIDALSGAHATPDAREVWQAMTDAPYPESLPKQAMLPWGRGSGKSFVLPILGLDRLLRFPNEQRVARGGEVTAMICAPTAKQASAAIRQAKPIAERLAALLGGSVKIVDASDGATMTFSIPGLEFTPILRVAVGDEASIRGAATVFVGFDESAWFPCGPRAVNTLESLYVAAVPRCAQFPWSLVAFASTNGPVGSKWHADFENPPPGLVKVGPVASWLASPNMSEEEIRRDHPPELVSQEFECLTHGLSNAAFVPAGASFACIDEEGTFTPKGHRRVPGIIGALDLRGASKDGDEGAGAFGYALEVEIAPGRFVRHLVIETIWSWSPKERVTFEDQARPVFRLASEVGCPVMADELAKANVAKMAREEFGYRDELDANEDERRAAIRRGGKSFVPRSMAAKAQTERWLKLRDLVISGRLHLPDTEGGRDAARELAGLRATTLANRCLRVEAAAGEQDGLADVLAFLAEAFEWVEASRDDGTEDRFVIEGTHWDPTCGDPLVVDGQWRRFRNGIDVGRGEPPITHPMFPQHFADCVASGMYTDRIIAFARQRLGSEQEPAPADYRLVVAQMAKAGEIDADHPAVVVGAGHGYDLDPIAWGMLRGKNRI